MVQHQFTEPSKSLPEALFGCRHLLGTRLLELRFGAPQFLQQPCFHLGWNRRWRRHECGSVHGREMSSYRTIPYSMTTSKFYLEVTIFSTVDGGARVPPSPPP